MKVYVDFEELDVEDKPTYICNKYNLQVKSINSGSIYENVKLISLSDYTKQVRKETITEIYEWCCQNHYSEDSLEEHLLNRIQGEDINA